MEQSTKKSAGFTLVELLIALALSLVVLTSVSSAFISQRKTYDAQEQITEMIQGTRAVMEIITREVKLAGYAPTGYDSKFESDPTESQTSPMMQRTDPTATRFVGIPYSATQPEIRADLDGDGTISTILKNEKIIYSHDSSELEIYRKSGLTLLYQPLLAENIQGFTVTYWKSDGTTQVTSSADEADIRQVKITLTGRTAKPDPDYGGYRTYTLTSVVAPPNLAID